MSTAEVLPSPPIFMQTSADVAKRELPASGCTACGIGMMSPKVSMKQGKTYLRCSNWAGGCKHSEFPESMGWEKRAKTEVKSGTCYNCNKEGHFASACTEPKKPRAFAPSPKVAALETEIAILKGQMASFSMALQQLQVAHQSK